MLQPTHAPCGYVYAGCRSEHSNVAPARTYVCLEKRTVNTTKLRSFSWNEPPACARIQLHSRITTSKKSNECNTQDEAMQRMANTIIGCRGMFLLSPTTNAHTCTAGIKKGTDQQIHVQDTCADQWPETAAQTLRFWKGSERPSADPPARAGNKKNANS